MLKTVFFLVLDLQVSGRRFSNGVSVDRTGGNFEFTASSPCRLLPILSLLYSNVTLSGGLP